MRGNWSQPRFSSHGSTGFVSGVSLRSSEEPPLYEKRIVNKDRDLWLEGQEDSVKDERMKGFAGQSGSSCGPHSEVEDDWGNGRKKTNSFGRNLAQDNFEQHREERWNGNGELTRKRDGRSWESRELNNEEFRNVSFHIKNEIEESLETGRQDEYNQSWGTERQITERGNFSGIEDQNNFDHQNRLNATDHMYSYREGQQGLWTGDKEGAGSKPNIIQQNERHSTNSKKRNFGGGADSDNEAESGKCSRKKLKEDIDLRLEKTNVETFDFPENLIGLLMGKKGATISRMKTLCSPAMITVPQACNARGFRAVRIEGYRMQIEKAKSVIYKMFKERRIENIVESFKKFVEDPTPINEENQCEVNPGFQLSHQDPGSRVEVEALKTKLSCMEREKYDLQNKISKLTSVNSELLDGKYKLQGQICKLNEEVAGQKSRIKSLELENKNFRMEKDFSEAADDSWKNISMEQIKQLNFQIETLAKELVKNNNELKARDDIINDLEQTSETRLKEIQMLQSEMERDFVQCDKCEEKFRSNELLRRHQRFKH